MSTKIGRNDPCHCGSGKKYKRCHLPLDQQRKPVVQQVPERDVEYFPPPNPNQPSAALLRDIAAKIPKNADAKLKELMAKSLEVADYMDSLEEIEAAGAGLESHREEFNKLLADETAFMNQARALFEEERFAPLWFTVKDLRRAFKHVGGPPDLSTPDGTAEKLREAILFIADKEKRTALAMNLVKHIPYYFKAGRFMDAWLIQYCGHATSESPENVNPFLFEMFSHGYDAWLEEENAGRDAVAQELGLDPLRVFNMDMSEMDALCEEMTKDPVKAARLQALMEAEPESDEQAEATMREMEREFQNLLSGDKGHTLFLTTQEVEPWLTPLLESWQEAVQNNPALCGGVSSKAESEKLFEEAFRPLLAEMAQAIFTPGRIQQLVRQLEKMGSEFSASDDKRQFIALMAARSSIQWETEPGENYYLLVLCFFAIRNLLDQIKEPTPEN